MSRRRERLTSFADESTSSTTLREGEAGSESSFQFRIVSRSVPFCARAVLCSILFRRGKLCSGVGGNLYRGRRSGHATRPVLNAQDSGRMPLPLRAPRCILAAGNLHIDRADKPVYSDSSPSNRSGTRRTALVVKSMYDGGLPHLHQGDVIKAMRHLPFYPLVASLPSVISTLTARASPYTVIPCPRNEAGRDVLPWSSNPCTMGACRICTKAMSYKRCGTFPPRPSWHPCRW